MSQIKEQTRASTSQDYLKSCSKFTSCFFLSSCCILSVSWGLKGKEKNQSQTSEQCGIIGVVVFIAEMLVEEVVYLSFIHAQP